MAKFGIWVPKEEGFQVPEIKAKSKEDIIHREPVEAVIYQPRRIWTITDLKSEQSLEVPAEGMIIGNDPEADFFINNLNLSSKQAKLSIVNNTLCLEALNEPADVYIGEASLEEPVILKDEDTFRLGSDEYFKINIREE